MSSSLVLASTLPLLMAWLGALAEPPGEKAERLVEHLSCASEVRESMREWRARQEEPLFDPSGPTGETVVRMPTAAFGVWVRLRVRSNDTVTLERVTADRVETRSIDAGCRVESGSFVPEMSAPGAWTDEELEDRIAAGDAGALVLWSPHMPLSADALETLHRVARDRGLALIAILDPGADPDYAERVVAERGLPTAALRPLGGIELAFRGMTTHAPSVQLFAGGRFVGPVQRGYRGEAAYAAIFGGIP